MKIRLVFFTLLLTLVVAFTILSYLPLNNFPFQDERETVRGYIAYSLDTVLEPTYAIYNAAINWIVELPIYGGLFTFVAITGATLVVVLVVYLVFRNPRDRITRRVSMKLEREFLIWKNRNKRGQVECPYCRRSFPPDLFDVDHKTPLAHGGSNRLANLHLVCRTCNVRKGTMNHEEFRALYTREGMRKK